MEVVQDGKAKKSQESLKQVQYDYKNLLGGMMRRFSLDVVGIFSLC